MTEDTLLQNIKTLLRAELAEMELRLVKQFATTGAVDALTQRIIVLETHGSPQAQALRRDLSDLQVRILPLEKARSEQVGEQSFKRWLYPILWSLAGGSFAAIATLVWLAHP